MNIYSQNIYEVIENNIKKHVLIIYNISENHYVGLTVYFHCDINGLPSSTAKIESMANFSYKRLREPFFRNKKIAHLTQDDYSNILISLKKYYTFEN